MSFFKYGAITAVGAGVAAYCVYYDHKRRNAPDYREKVTARREAEKTKSKLNEEIVLPDCDDKQAVEHFFVKQIELGEELIQTDVDRAVKHLSYAIVYCPQPQSLIQYFREILPSTAFEKLVEVLPEANSRANASKKRIVEIEEDDVE